MTTMMKFWSDPTFLGAIDVPAGGEPADANGKRLPPARALADSPAAAPSDPGPGRLPADESRVSAAPTDVPEQWDLMSITIDPPTATLSAHNQQSFTAWGHYANDEQLDETLQVIWGSPDEATLAFDSTKKGLAIANDKPGTVVITAMDPNTQKFGTATITVLELAATDSQNNKQMDVDDAYHKGIQDGKIDRHEHMQELERKGEPGLKDRMAAYYKGYDEGLASPGAPKHPKDERIALLYSESRLELSDAETPDYQSLGDDYADPIREYEGLRQQLKDYLANIDEDNSTTKDIGEGVVKAWTKAVHETGEKRQFLAGRVNLRLDQPISDEYKRFQTLTKEMKELKEKNERVEKDLEQIEDGVKWAGIVLKINDAVEMLEESVEKLPEISTKLAKARLALTGYKIATMSTTIDKGIETLASYSAQLSYVAEGFTSAEDMERRVKNKADQLAESFKKLNDLLGRREKALENAGSSTMENPE